MDINTTAMNGVDTITNKLPDLPYLEMGSGFAIGLAVGYVFKKSFKILLLIVGAGVILLFGLEHFHIVTIDESHLEETVEMGTSSFKQVGLFLKERLTRMGVAGSGSAVAGFLAGLKMG